MKSFFVRWRSTRLHREYEIFADCPVGAIIMEAMESAEGLAVWQEGTLWKCPGCGDRTLRTEEFLEGLRRAELFLRREEEWRTLSGDPEIPERDAAMEWMADIAAKMLGCERDRVYIKDEDGQCTFGNENYISRI